MTVDAVDTRGRKRVMGGVCVCVCIVDMNPLANCIFGSSEPKSIPPAFHLFSLSSTSFLSSIALQREP